MFKKSIFVKHNLIATAAPSVSDDVTLGYKAGSQWADTVTNKLYYCISPSVGAAVWKEFTSSENISNTDLTWSGPTTQDLNGNTLTFANGEINLSTGGSLMILKPDEDVTALNPGLTVTSGKITNRQLGHLVFDVIGNDIQDAIAIRSNRNNLAASIPDTILNIWAMDGYSSHFLPTVPILDGRLKNNQYSFYESAGKLKARYKDNGGVVSELQIGDTVEYNVFSIKDSSGVPTYYNDIYSAFAAATTGAVIEQHADVIITSVVNLHTYADDLTLNNNGYNLYHTSNTGTEFYLFYRDLGAGTKTFSLSGNGKIISNGTGSTTASAVFYGINVLYNSNVLTISTNNPVYQSVAEIYEANCRSSNGVAMSSGTVYRGYLEGVSTYGTIYNAFIKLNSVSGGSGCYVGTSSHVIDGCTILDVNGAGTRSIYFRNGGKLRNTNVYINTGASKGLDIGAGTTLTGIPDVDNVKVIHKGTGIAGSFTYGRVKNSSFYSESNVALSMGANCANYNPAVEDCDATTNSATHNAYAGLGAVIVRRLKTYNLNASNPNASFQIFGTAGQDTIISDCEANVNNASAPNTNISLVATANYYLVNHTESLLGTGTNWNTQSNSQTGADGNIKIG